MGFEVIKKAGEFVGECKDKAEVYKPQLTAMASTACFLGAVYSATKEAPEANEAMATMCAELANENSSLREAAEKIVGVEKAEQINQKAKHIEETPGSEKDADTDLPPEHRYVPVRLKLTGQSRYSSKKEMLKRLEKCVDYMAKCGYIEAENLVHILGYDEDCDLIEDCHAWFCVMGDKESARKALDWYFEPDEDEYGRLGYTLHIAKPQRNE